VKRQTNPSGNGKKEANLLLNAIYKHLCGCGLDRISNTYGKVRYLSKSESGCGLFGMILLHQRIIC
jgi:hypothetical protein